MEGYKLIIEDFKKHLEKIKTEKSKRLQDRLDQIKSFDEFKELQMELHYNSWYNAFN